MIIDRARDIAVLAVNGKLYFCWGCLFFLQNPIERPKGVVSARYYCAAMAGAHW